jgi:agmatinase
MNVEPTSTPIRPFLDWPVVTDPAEWNAQVAVIGIQHSEPYAGDPWPNDQARAPDAIRKASDNISFGPDQWDFDLDSARSAFLPSRCLDIGNIAWSGQRFDDYFAATVGRLRHAWSTGTQLYILGGDHGVTIPAMEALQAVGERVYIVHIDAHLDWREEVGGATRGYSSPLRWASRLPWIRGMTQIGLRATGSARAGEVAAARAYGSHLFPAHEVHARGIDPVIDSIPDDAPLYITIDADGMDPTEMPGVMAPAPGGLYYRMVGPFLETLAARQRVVGFDIVEIAPRFDASSALTCVTAGRLMMSVLGGSWKEKGGGRR